MKVCARCNESKVPDEFHRDAGRADGRFPWCKECRKTYGSTEHYRETTRTNYRRDPLRYAHYRKGSDGRLRERVMGHYGGTVCACCGSLDDLSLDHVSGNGADHRRELFGDTRAHGIYRWLERHGYPDGYQVLCKPCNRSKGRTDRCHLDHGDEPSLPAGHYVPPRDAPSRYIPAVRLGRYVRDHYGPACACCGSTDRVRVSHVRPYGVKAEFGGDRRAFLRWLIDNNFPADAEAMCTPCVTSKSNGPYCNLAHVP